MTVVDSFFFDFFSTISNFSIFPKKVIGPDASENVLGHYFEFLDFSEKGYRAR